MTGEGMTYHKPTDEEQALIVAVASAVAILRKDCPSAKVVGVAMVPAVMISPGGDEWDTIWGLPVQSMAAGLGAEVALLVKVYVNPVPSGKPL